MSIWPAMLLAGALWLGQTAHSAETATTQGAAVYDLVEQGRQALLADKYSDSLALLKKAISKPEFQNVEAGLQYFAFLLASHAANASDDNLGAYEFVSVATQFPDANGDTWMHRARIAASLEMWEQAGLALLMTARKWPKALQGDQYQAQMVNRTVHELGKQAALHQERFDLLNALFDADYKIMFDTEPSYLWLVLATESLERQDKKRAREAARHITAPSILVAMRIDRRFDALTSEDPKTFDVRAAAEREARKMKTAMKENPKKLIAVVQYGYALHTLGKFEDMLSLAEGILAKVEQAPKDEPLYEDLDDHLNWIHNHKATALRALGKWDEAAATLASWERSDRNRQDKASQAINLGFFYNELGRPDGALKAVERVDWSREMSEYGRTQFQFVRFQAYQQLGKESEAQEIVAWFRQHKADSLETAQSTFLESGDADGAATLLVSRLGDAEERATALAEIQNYAQTPRTERQKKLAALNESLLSRPDVAAAIAQYGRREKFSIYSLEY